ncbi:MAG: hypothetical protein ACK55Z_23820, partial [bacterium]
ASLLPDILLINSANRTTISYHLMRTFILASLTAASFGRVYRGECIDMSRNFFKELGKEDFDPSKI